MEFILDFSYYFFKESRVLSFKMKIKEKKLSLDRNCLLIKKKKYIETPSTPPPD